MTLAPDIDTFDVNTNTVHNVINSNFLDRVQLLMQKLLNRGYVVPMLKSSLQKLYGRHYNLVDRYEISISQMTMDISLFM
jgi:hypothetical protein